MRDKFITLEKLIELEEQVKLGQITYGEMIGILNIMDSEYSVKYFKEALEIEDEFASWVSSKTPEEIIKAKEEWFKNHWRDWKRKNKLNKDND